MTKALAAVAMTGLVGLLFPAPAIPTEEESSNQAMYLRYCGACHGPEGKGDGIVGTSMRPRPADLTQMAKKNGGEFPVRRTIEIINGRKTLRAHGDAGMPVWGEVFSDPSRREMDRSSKVQGKILLITAYIRSIQQQ